VRLQPSPGNLRERFTEKLGAVEISTSLGEDFDYLQG